MSEEEVYHIPALLPQSIEALSMRENGTYVDATYGGGGHSRAIVERLSADGHLYGFDQDDEAVSRSMKDPRFTIVYSNFRFLKNFLRYYGVRHVDGILADLGVSFHHFDDSNRGFSFRFDSALDMRMNRNSHRTAEWVIGNYSESQLADVLYLYGELKSSRRMASAIVKAREAAPIKRVGELLEVIKPLINPRQEKKELAMVFQALRIEVNGELDALKDFLRQAVDVLLPGGRLAVITYHSLEDRLVKNFMRTGNFAGEVEKDFFGHVNAPMKLLGSKPIVPDAEEIERNPRSRSAKLRVAEKMTEDGKE